jgi:2-polyprenyl-3-methyl-5-hydroxy-6-metoxy-1,4-benzoquinol methylase
VVEEGDIKTNRVAKLPANVRPDKVEFKLGDALSLAPDMGTFDAVVAANIVDRLAAPAALLQRLGGPRGLVRPGGILLVASPFTWLEKYTPRELWLGGRETPEGDVHSMERLKKLLSPNFQLLKEGELPFVLREHSHKYEYVLTNVTVWKHK